VHGDDLEAVKLTKQQTKLEMPIVGRELVILRGNNNGEVEACEDLNSGAIQIEIKCKTTTVGAC
jgi:hypothetical protein